MTEPAAPKGPQGPQGPQKPQEPRRRRTSRTRNGRGDQEDFRETLAAPVPNQTYRSQIDLIGAQPSVAEQIIRLVAAILDLLLVGRIIAYLFTSDPANTWIKFFSATTGWMVWPFQAFLGQPTDNTTLGYFDWPAVAAFFAVIIVATILIRIVRPPQV